MVATEYAQGPDRHRVVRAWLLTLWLMVLMMVTIGGITRLTGSGLSMVQWHPVTGVLPPIGERAWEQAFDAYRRSPQFVQQNHWMTLSDFQKIYFWEYVHRLFGRTMGFAFLLPWLYFVGRGVLSRKAAWKTSSVLLLGALQGLAGWYMVKSGLVNQPQVSHYRLALHLLLGIGTGQWILWLALEFLAPRRRQSAAPSRVRAAVLGFVPLLALQIVYGAFMAGTHAGYAVSTFPDMNGHYGPGPFFISGSLARDLLYNPLSIHYLHRALGVLVLLYTLALVALSWRRGELRALALLLLAAVCGQIALGALTVVLHVPTAVAVTHQAGAYVLSSATTLLVHASLGAQPATATDTAAVTQALEGQSLARPS